MISNLRFNSKFSILRILFLLSLTFALYSGTSYGEERFTARLAFFAIQSTWKPIPGKPQVYEEIDAHFDSNDLGRFQDTVKSWKARVEAECLKSGIPFNLKLIETHHKAASHGFSSHSQEGVYVAFVYKDGDDFSKHVIQWESDLVAQLKKLSEFLQLDRRENKSFVKYDHQNEAEIISRLLKSLTLAFQ